MSPKVLAAGVASFVALTTALMAGGATAGHATKQQRIAIDFYAKSGTFVLTPLTAGPIRSDSGMYSSCCWTRRRFVRDGQSMENDDPTVTLHGRRGTFIWHEVITYVESDNDYTAATAVWTITDGTGVYDNLEGHGREAAVNRTKEDQEVAAKAEGLVDLAR
jgi:hypothetical protein